MTNWQKLSEQYLEESARMQSIPESLFRLTRSVLFAVIYMVVLCVGAWGGPIVNGSFQTELADLNAGGLITGWTATGSIDWVCVAQSGAPYPCGADPTASTKYPTTLADGSRAYRVGANGDFPRDPGNPDEATNSIYEATWTDILDHGYNYLSQQTATSGGTNYLLTFQLQAMYAAQPYYGFWVVVDHNPIANLSVRTQSNPVLRTDTANQWATFQIPFTATGPVTEIGFASFVECNLVGCDIDLFLDNVALETQVPEPATALLMGVGLSLGWAARRLRCWRVKS